MYYVIAIMIGTLGEDAGGPIYRMGNSFEDTNFTSREEAEEMVRELEYQHDEEGYWLPDGWDYAVLEVEEPLEVVTVVEVA